MMILLIEYKSVLVSLLVVLPVNLGQVSRLLEISQSILLKNIPSDPHPSQLCTSLFLETGGIPSLVSSFSDYFIIA